MRTAQHSHRIMAVHPGAERYGSDRMFAEAVTGFLLAGHDVQVVLPGEGPLGTQLRATGASVDIADMPVLRKSALSPRGLITLPWQMTTGLVQAISLLRSHRPDVVYVSTLTIPTWLLAARLSGVRVVCHVHEAEQAASRVVRTGLAAPLLLTDKVILNSAFSANVLNEAVPALERRGTVVPNGVGAPTGATIAPREKLEGPVKLLFVGRISPRKGPDVAIDALRRLRDTGTDAHLRIVGSVFDGYEWFEEQLRSDAADLIDAGIVTLQGFTDDVWSELAACDIALVPSVMAEPFGNTAVEAVLAQRPVVVSNIGGLPEAVSGIDSADLARAGDALALAEAVRRVIDAWPQMIDRAAAARDRALIRFAPESYRASVTQLVCDLDRGTTTPSTATDVDTQTEGTR
ncbi:Glycosyltransferase involved in cell wall bisynthesis [Austwickia chelonae]|uniref:Putative glycosyltransferase n=1 Tax=Austwickia chelonae NBRC 105200 TaxID=1184607 RepID=K6VQP1_9MICO|nr:glycosyltransferase family 4 protein [Austwickia chelonae]GAB79029.1 putative glycosyltransferase [Austwickia chelonae NBRC 105200]SEW41732.1 Glycosyltransferase involved in cell wall bisynthesis [Austwickia chelonae]